MSDMDFTDPADDDFADDDFADDLTDLEDERTDDEDEFLGFLAGDYAADGLITDLLGF